MNKPPRPKVETLDRERRPLCCQATSMPLGNATRVNLRFTIDLCGAQCGDINWL